jgi:hypothetical protein
MVNEKTVEDELEELKKDPRYKLREIYDNYKKYFTLSYVRSLTLFHFLVYISGGITAIILLVIFLYTFFKVMGSKERLQVVYAALIAAAIHLSFDYIVLHSVQQ